MKKVVLLLFLIVLSTGCVSETTVVEDIPYDEKTSKYDFNQSYYNQGYAYLELETVNKYVLNSVYENYEFKDDQFETPAYRVIHIKTFAPSTNHELVIQNVSLTHEETSWWFGITPIGHTGWTLSIDAKVNKTGDIGGSAITPVKKAVITRPDFAINSVEVNIDNTIDGKTKVVKSRSELKTRDEPPSSWRGTG